MALVGESSKMDVRARREGDLAVKASTMDALFFTGFRGVASSSSGERLSLYLPCLVEIGEFNSGEREGNDVRDLSVAAVVGVVWGLEILDEGFLGLRTRSDLRLLLDVVLLVLEGVRCRLPSLLLSMLQLSVTHQ